MLNVHVKIKPCPPNSNPFNSLDYVVKHILLSQCNFDSLLVLIAFSYMTVWKFALFQFYYKTCESLFRRPRSFLQILPTISKESSLEWHLQPMSLETVSFLFHAALDRKRFLCNSKSILRYTLILWYTKTRQCFQPCHPPTNFQSFCYLPHFLKVAEFG